MPAFHTVDARRSISDFRRRLTSAPFQLQTDILQTSDVELRYSVTPMAIRTELNLRLPNSPGALAGICALLSNERVNIIALALEGMGQLRLVVDNHVHAAATLRDHHHQVTERDVIVVSTSNAPGSLAPTLRLVADAGVNVEYAYAGAPDGSATAAIVLGVDDAVRAAAAAGV